MLPAAGLRMTSLQQRARGHGPHRHRRAGHQSLALAVLLLGRRSTGDHDRPSLQRADCAAVLATPRAARRDSATSRSSIRSWRPSSWSKPCRRSACAALRFRRRSRVTISTIVDSTRSGRRRRICNVSSSCIRSDRRSGVDWTVTTCPTSSASLWRRRSHCHPIFGGVLDRYPGLRICAAHGGGYLPHYVGRSDLAFRVRPEAGGIAEPPSHYLKRIWFDTVVHGPRTLRQLIDVVGASRVVVGIDYPFDMGAYRPHELLAAIPDLSPQDRRHPRRQRGKPAAPALRVASGGNPPDDRFPISRPWEYDATQGHQGSGKR